LLLEQTFEGYPHSQRADLEVAGELKMTSYALNAVANNPSLAKLSEKTPVNQSLLAVRLTPRGRAVARLAVVTSLSILLLSGFAAINGASAGSSETAIPTPYIKVSVKPGETLWSIADSIDPNGDRRSLVADIVELNQLRSPELQAGQKIYIPTRP
jgi:LysM repeat protein